MLKTKKAFTIIEIMMSMVFLSVMMILIGYTIIRFMNIYNKGISIKNVNETADLIIGDMQDSIASGSYVKCAIKYKNYDNMRLLASDSETCKKLLNNDPSEEITGGAICTGRVSYVWNYGASLQKAQEDPNYNRYLFRYKDQAGNPKNIRMARINDLSGTYCTEDITSITASGNPNALPALYKLNPNELSAKNSVIELIEDNDKMIALHSLSVTSSAYSQETHQSLYEIEFVLGTFRDKLILTEDAQCRTLRQAYDGDRKADGTIDESTRATEQDINHCAITKFNFAMRGLKGKGKW